MKSLVLVLSLFFITSTYGASNELTTGNYMGGGFGYSLVGLTPTGQTASDFKGWTGIVEVGTNLEISGSFGLNLAGEYRITEVNNTIDSTTYMEKAKIYAATAKLGFYFGSFTLGGGYSKSQIEVSNVSSTTSSSTTKFSGHPTLIYMNY